MFGYNGQTYAMDRAEFDDFKVTLLDTLRRDTGEPLRNKYLLLVDNWHSIRILNEHHRVVSYICEMLGATELEDAPLDAAQQTVDTAWQTLGGADVNAALDAVRLAEQAVNEAIDAYCGYMAALESGGELAVTALTVTETAAFAVASVAAGAALVAAGVGAVGAAAVSGGGTALVQGLATHAPQVVGGEERLDAATIKIVIDTGMNALGAGLAAKFVPGVTNQLTARIADSLGDQCWRGWAGRRSPCASPVRSWVAWETRSRAPSAIFED